VFISVQPHLRYGGAERQTVLLSNVLQRRGAHPLVLLHEKTGGLLSELDPAVPVHSLGLDDHLLTPLVARRLRQTLEDWRSAGKSLVVFHLWSSILAGAMAERREDDSFRFVYYEDLDPSEHARFIRFGRMKQRLIRSVFRRGGVLVANTERVADAMTRVYGLPTRPRVISPAVDLRVLRDVAAWRARSVEPRTRPLKVATVGSLVPLKGLDVVYEGLLQSGLECEWHVIGEGPLRGWLDSLPDDGPVVVRPRGGHPRPYELVADADLLVHGAHSEALGLVLLEAIGVGVPVVSSAALGPGELAAALGDRREILSLFTPGRADELALVLKDRASALDLTPSVEDMQLAIDRFSLEATADAWSELADEHACAL
jgi:glycosyltransferase involved in cell wall biosynthesis